MKKRLLVYSIFGLLVTPNIMAQQASTPCAAGPLPGSCTPNNITVTTSDANSGVTDPTVENGVGCPSVGTPATAGVIVDYDVWYTTTADANGDVQVYAAIITGDPVIGIYSGPNCSTLTLENCDDDSGTGLDAYATASGLTPGATVWVRAWDYNGGTGTYSTAASGGTPPANDDCANAQTLTLNAAPVPGTGYCSTVEASDYNDCEGITEGNVWYTFTTTTAGAVDVNITNTSCFGSGSGVDISIFSGTCGSFTSVTCMQNVGVNTVTFNPNPSTTYYVMVDGNNDGGANSLCDFDIDVDQAVIPCGTVDFHAEENASPFNTINPFPSTMTCEDDWVYLVANDSVASGGYITPSLHFEFDAQADNNDDIIIYSGGTGALGSGTVIYANTLANNTVLTVYGEYLSPGTDYYFEICDVNAGQDVPWQVYDGNTYAVYGSGTDASGNGTCTRYGPFSPGGSATWGTDAPAASVGAFDNGLMYFDPALSGPGTFDFTYYWDNGGACLDSATRSITVTNPYSFTSLSYTTACEGSGNVSPSLNATTGGTYSSATLGASLNTSTGVVNTNTAPTGTHTITYTVGTMPCGATGNGTITINEQESAGADDLVNAICNSSGNTIDLDGLLSGNTTTGTWLETTGTPSGQFNAGTGVFDASGLTAGTYTFTYTVSSTAPCVDDVANFAVQVENQETAGADDLTNPICNASGNTIDLDGLLSGNSTTGTWAETTGTPSGQFNTGTGVFDASGLSAGSYTFTYTVNSTAPCGPDVANFEVQVEEQETAGADDLTNPICNTSGSTIDLDGILSGNSTTGTWAETTGTPSGQFNTGTGVFDANGLTAGTYTFTYTVSSTSPCGDDVANFAVQVENQETAGADDLTNPICNASGNTLDLDGVLNGNSTTGTWAETTGTPSGQFNTGTGVFDASGLTAGTYTFTYTVSSTSPCGDDVANFEIQVENQETAGADDLTNPICNASGNTLDLDGVLSGNSTTGTWAETTGTPSGQFNTGTGVFDASGLTAGTYTFTYTVSSTSPCGDDVANFEIQVENQETAGADDLTNPICNANGSTLDLDGLLSGNSTTGTWAETTGTPSGQFNTGTGVFDASGLSAGSYTFTYTVNSTSPCGSDVANFEVQVNPQPAAVDQNPSVCEDAGTPGTVAGIDLTSLDISVNGGSGDPVSWFTDAGLTSPVGSPGSTTVNNNDVFYALVDNGNCTDTATITYSVTSNISLTDPAPEICEDVAGGGVAAGIDLTSYNGSVYGGGGTLTWYTDSGMSNPVTDETNEDITNGEVFYVNVVAGNCNNSTAVTFTINPLPNSIPTSMELCDEGGNQATFNLTSLDNTINGGSGDGVTWFTDAGTSSSIGTPGAYVTGSTTVYALVTNSTTSCSDTAEVTLTVNPLPAVNPASINLCDDGSGNATFDLTSVEPTVNTGIGDTVVWYDNAALTNVIATPGAYVSNGVATVYAQVIDTATGCSDTASVVITVDPLPTANDDSINLCDEGSGTATFDLTSIDASVNGGSGNSVDWFEDALGTVSIGTPNAFVTGNDTVYAVVTDGVTSCVDTAMVILTIDALPTALDQTFNLCEDAGTPGSVAGVDLTLYDGTVNGATADVVTWYDNGFVAVGTPTNVTINDNDIYYAIVDNGTCVDTAEVTFEVSSTISPADPMAELCEDAVGSGSVANVDLTSYENTIYNGAAPVFVWYQDAGLTTQIGNPTDTTITNGMTVYVDVTDGNCNNNTSVTFTVNSQFFSQDTITVCNGDSVTHHDGTVDTNITSTIVHLSTLSTQNSCDSVIETTVLVIPVLFEQDFVSVCNGGSYTYPDGTTDTNITTQTTHQSTIQSPTTGCDSIVETIVDVDPVIFSQELITICSGESYTYPDGTTDTNITAQVVHQSMLQTAAGCDSIIETTVNVNPIVTESISESVCNGDSYTFPDGTVTLTSDTTYAYTFTGGAATGCDSIVTYNITVNDPVTNQVNDAVCSGDTYTFPDGTVTLTSDTSYTYTFTNGSSLGCDSIVTFNVTVDPLLSATPNAFTPVCFGETVVLSATSSGNGTVTWYSDAAGTNVIGTGSPLDITAQITSSGTYTFYVNESGTCSSTLESVTVVIGGVTADISANPSSGLAPLQVNFINNSSPTTGVTYAWTFGDGAGDTSVEPSHTYVGIGSFVAQMIISDGVCYDTASVVIETQGKSTILIPNVFTPNEDGQNDVFTVSGENLESVEGEIYNRWGQKLFEWAHVKGYWDGRTLSGEECPDGTYFYIIKAKGFDGEEYFKKGGFSLIR